MYDCEKLKAAVNKERLPKVKGYKILVAMPDVSEKTKGGLYMPEELKDREKAAAIIGLVMAMGLDAYADKDRTSHRWCEVGDWVIFRAYSGTRFKVDGQEYRLINDDSVEAVVPDPTGYERA